MAATKRAAAKKSGRKSGPGQFKPGADARRGKGPKKGAPNAGRPADDHRAWCQELVCDAAAEAAVRRVITDPEHPAFATMWKAVAERGYGKPALPVELGVTASLADLIRQLAGADDA